MRYLQRRDEHGLETVDQAETVREASFLLVEYRLSDSSAEYYDSARPCRHWAVTS